MYSGDRLAPCVVWAIREFTFSGLTVDQLHAVLSTWLILPKETKSWEEALAASHSGNPYPLGPFAYLVQSIHR